MIFCLLPYLSYYDGTEAPDIPAGMNFLPIAVDGVELLFGAVPGKQKLSFPKSVSASEEGFITGETVVFCAKAESGALVTVGWYENANVTAEPEVLSCENEDGSPCEHPFFFCARAEHAVLLPEDTRYESCWSVPRNKSGSKAKYGFSSDPVWFAEEPNAALWKQHFAEQIASYAGDNWLFPDEETEEDG